MVREASRRKQKFEAKVDPEVLSRQTRALKPLMVKGESEYFPQVTSLEERIKKLVEAKGVTTLEIRDYLNYGREILNLSKRFSGTTLQAEAQLKTDKWSTRGLDGSTLVEVAELMGITPTAPDRIECLFDFLREDSIVVSLLKTTATAIYLNLLRDTLRATAYPLTRKCQFQSLAYFNYTYVASGEIRAGIYDSLPKTRYPNKLISPSVDIPCEFTGLMEFDLDITLDKGLYYIATLCNDDNIRTYMAGNFLPPLGVPKDVFVLTASLGSWIKDYEFGDLPAQFPEGATQSNQLWVLGLRLKRLL